MNPQFIQQQQQQRSYYEPQAPNNTQFGEMNANMPPKGAQDHFPIQRPANVGHPPTMNAQNNKNNLVDQISNMALTDPQKPPPMQNYSVPPENTVSSTAMLPNVNGIISQNHYPGQGETEKNISADKSPQSAQKMFTDQKQPLTNQQISNTSAYTYGPPPVSAQFTNQQYNDQQSLAYNAKTLSQGVPPPPNVNQTNALMNKQPLGHSPSRFVPPASNQSDSSAPHISGQSDNLITQSNMHSGSPFLPAQKPPLSGGPPLSNIPLSGGPPLSNPPLSGGPPMSNSSLSGGPLLSNLPLSGGPPLSNPPLSGGPPLTGGAPSSKHPLLGGPPLSNAPLSGGSSFSSPNLQGGPPLTNPSLPGGPPFSSSSLSGHSMTSPLSSRQNSMNGPPLLNQNASRPPLAASNLSGPAIPNQQNLSAAHGQQNIQNFQSQYSQSNQMAGQRQYPPNSSLQGQHTSPNPYSPNPQSDLGYQQQNYGYQQNHMYGNQGSPYQPGPGMQPPQQPKRLDPDQMPSPIQVILDDQRLKGGDFITNQRGLVPPLITTKFIAHDQGNASPRFVRSTIYTVPTTNDLIKQTNIPFALVLSPMAQVEEAEYEPPIVDMGEIGPVRCHRCKAYMSPFMQFIDAGRRFQCMLCKATTEVPTEYFQHLDHQGQRMDRCERPELMLGTYEFLATKDYCKKEQLPNPPAIIFVLDVSYNTMKSGLIKLICSQMKKIISNLPVDADQTKSNMKVGFITYNNSVHFYNIKANLAQPQMMVVGDIDDVFMPLLDGFLCNPEESEVTIDSLMEQIPAMFSDTRETETILGPAIQAGLEALKASECAGKLIVFHSSLPIAEAPGKLKNRDDRKLLGTDKEKTVLAPQTNFYNNLGQECVSAGCSVDLFIFNNSYIDVATIGQVCRLSGGELYKYTYFQAETDGERLTTDIINNISRPIAFDAVMRVRTSTGVRPTDFYGHYYMSNTTDLELASIDCDKAIAIEIKHDDKLSEDEGVYIQAALLYTSCSGVRRLRIINLSLKSSSQMADLYRACDLDAMINFFLKQSVFKIVETSPKAVKDNLTSRCVNILTAYRKNCASPSNAGQLILPECMKLLPLYTNGLLKSDALSGGAGITIDQKSYIMMTAATMSVAESVFFVYPRLLPLHNVDTQSTDIPLLLRCSIDKFEDHGAYILENGIYMFLWLGSALSPQWVQSVFGVSSVNDVNTDKSSLPVLDNPLNNRIREIMACVQSERRFSMRLTITRQRDKLELVMRQFLVEDRGADGSPSYVEFLCHMHREIRQLLS